MTNKNKNKTTKILFGQGNVNDIMNPLIPFNCIYDIDAGLVRYMYENGYTTNAELIDPGFFNIFTLDDNVRIVRELYTRKCENPLKLFTRPGVDADDLYNQFMQSDYENIIRSAYLTGIAEFVYRTREEKSIKTGILYSAESEYYMLKDTPLLEGIDLIDIDDIGKHIDDYTAYFFKSIDDMYIDLFASKLRTKSVYIMDYSYNFKEDGDLKDSIYLADLALGHNQINIINAYDRQRLELEAKSFE